MQVLYRRLEGEFYDYNINIRLEDNDITISFILPSQSNYELFMKSFDIFFEDYGYDRSQLKIIGDSSKIMIFQDIWVKSNNLDIINKIRGEVNEKDRDNN